MRFKDLVDLQSERIQPKDITERMIYLGYENFKPGGLRYDLPENPQIPDSSKFAFHNEDIIYGRLRPYFRKVAWCKHQGVCSSDFWVFRAKSGVDSRFAFYTAALPAFSDHATLSATGTRMPRASWEAVSEFKVQDFSYEEQVAIGTLLGALDDKIESNLAASAGTIDLIDALIREVLNDGNHAEIPVSALADFINGGAFTKGASGDGRVVIRIAELNSGITANTVRNDIEVADKHLADLGDILMAWSGSLGVYVWHRSRALINQHIFKVIPAEGYPYWLVYNALERVMPIYQGIARDKATTMGHIKRADLDTTKVKIPTADIIKELDLICAPLWETYLLKNREQLLLSDLRDTLLPELMSGRMRVDEAQGLIMNALETEDTHV